MVRTTSNRPFPNSISTNNRTRPRLDIVIRLYVCPPWPRLGVIVLMECGKGLMQLTIAHFRVHLILSIKARPGAQPFIWLICMWMKSHFHMKGWAPRIALRNSKRFKEIRKWPIVFRVGVQYRGLPVASILSTCLRRGLGEKNWSARLQVCLHIEITLTAQGSDLPFLIQKRGYNYAWAEYHL